MSANVNSRMTMDSFVAHVVAANRQQDAIAAGHLTQQTASVVDEIVTHRRSDNIVRRKRIDARQEHAESLAEVRFPSKLVRIARPPVSHLLIENSSAHRCCGSLVLPFVLRICILSGVKGDIVSV